MLKVLLRCLFVPEIMHRGALLRYSSTTKVGNFLNQFNSVAAMQNPTKTKKCRKLIKLALSRAFARQC
jgi:hypothetical protein